MKLPRLIFCLFLATAALVFHSCKEEVMPSCSDGIQNGTETDIDCGGSCPECPTCTDGIQNGTETGIDCGGSCPECPTCTDGIQNGTETGIDCGGSCPECPTCTDGIQNGTETGIDCGGGCPECPTCIDGIQNGTETGIDCGGSCPECFVNCGTIMDFDGNVYNTVQIGSQCWTQENLKVEHYRNVDAIPTGLSDTAWQTTTSGAFAVYNNVAANKATYGLLYNWYAVADARGLCPTGWHVPTDAEWTQLTDHLGGTSVAGGQMKTTGTLGAGTGLWQAPNTAATNSSGFSGLPGGARSIGGFFTNQGSYGDWWSSSEDSASFAWPRRLLYVSGVANRFNNFKRNGFSVRCLRD